MTGRDLSGLTVTELISLADDDEVWTSVCELQARGTEEVFAAAQIADPRLYPHLVSLRGTYPEENLEEAIESCRPPGSQA